MIPQSATAHFGQIVRDEMFEMDRQLAQAFSSTVTMAIKSGGLHSGRTLVGLHRDSTNSLQARGQVVLSQLLRCLAAHHVPMDTETVAEAMALLKQETETQVRVVRDQLFGIPLFKATATSRQARSCERSTTSWDDGS